MTYKQGRITGYLIALFIFVFIFLGLCNYENKEIILCNNDTIQEVKNIKINRNTVYNYTYKFKIDNTMFNKYIELYTLNATVTAEINDINIYKDVTNETLSCIGTKWHFIKIKEEYIGKDISIRICTHALNYNIDNVKIYTGYYGDLLINLVTKIRLEIFFNCIIFILCIIIGVIYLLQKHNKIHTRPSNLWLCFGGLIFILFVFSSTFIRQLVINNAILQYYMYYLLLYIIPLVLLNYISDLLSKLDSVVEFYILYITDLVVLIGQLTRTYFFTESIYVYLIILLITFIAIIAKTIRLLVRTKKVVTRKIGIMYIIVLLSIPLNCTLSIFNKEIEHPFLFMQLIVIVFMILNIYYSTITLVKDIEEIQENSAYREIALKDKLTGLNNRYAFDKDIASISSDSIENLGIISMDINNLKYYNDNFGHMMGDILIKEASKLISSVFTNVYRTGGDEFVAIVNDETVEILDEKKETLVRKTIKYNKDSTNDLLLEIAVGYSKYKFGDKSYEQILTRSDAEMYKHKEQLKERSSIKSIR